MLAASALVWLLSIALFVLGLIFLIIPSLRSKALPMLAGSVLIWILSMGMCIVAPTPDVMRRAGFDGTPSTSAKESPSAATSPTSSPAPVEKPAPIGKWTGGAGGASAMDDTQTIAYSLTAENDIAGWLQTKRPTLIVRCHERKTAAYVVVGMSSQPELGRYEQYTVRIRFDDTAATKEIWSESTDNEALFSPSPVNFARKMASAKRLRFEFTPFNASRQVVEFDVAGFADPLRYIAKGCDWKP